MTIAKINLHCILNGALFTQEIPKQQIVLCLDYDIALRLQNIEYQK